MSLKKGKICWHSHKVHCCASHKNPTAAWHILRLSLILPAKTRSISLKHKESQVGTEKELKTYRVYGRKKAFFMSLHFLFLLTPLPLDIKKHCMWWWNDAALVLVKWQSTWSDWQIENETGLCEVALKVNFYGFFLRL